MKAVALRPISRQARRCVEEEFAQAVLLLASGAVDVDTPTTAVLIGPKQSTGGWEATTTV
jgi:hypothetical protein